MAETYEGLYVKFGADTVEFDNSIKGMNKALAGLKKDISTLNKQLKFDPDNVDLLTKKLENFEEQARVGALKIEELRKQQAALGSEKIGTAEWNKFELEINRVQGQMVTVNRAINSTRKSIKDVGDPQSVYNLNKAINDVAADLDIVNRKLQLDPSNVALSAKKMLLLKEQSELANQKVVSLMKELASFGIEDIGTAEFKEVQRALGNAEIEAKQLENAIEDLGNAGKEASDEVGEIKNSLSAGAIGGAVSGAVQSMADSLGNLIEETKEYRMIMASLEESSKNAGYSASETRQVYQTLQGVLGDTQSAATATANLQALGLSQQDLMNVTNASIGAWAKYGDSIPIDGLAESINETIKAGQVTGTFADVLNWAGTNEDEFNKKLAQCKTDSERTNVVMQELANQGLTQSGKAWQENNKDMVEANKAQDNLNQAMSGLAQTLQPIMTAIIQGITQVVNWFNNLSPAGKTVVAVIGGIVAALVVLGPAILSVMGAVTALEISLAPVIAIVVGIVAAITAVILIIKNWGTITQWLSDMWTEFKSRMTAIWNGIKTVISVVVNAVKTVITTIFNGIKTYFQTVFNIYKTIFTTVWNAIVTVVTTVVNTIKTIITTVFNAISTVITTVWNRIKSIFTSALNGIKSVVQNAWNTIKNVFSKGVSSILNIIGNIKNKIAAKFKGLPSAIKNAIGNLASVGKAIINGILSGLTGIAGRIKDKIVDGISSAKRGLGDIAASIFGKSFGGVNYDVGVNGGSFLNDVIKMQKGFSMPKIMAGTNSATTLNISVSANNSNGMEIARAVERVIVRRLT
ncbi:hypothetical protein [Anaerofustis butyriciformans]|uniref:hypothetical protein n=1 Tax=Anaerofustis butyriciformans TaxID=3108533 RepID=UPI002E317780|nr:hypothetical protein [Anaerofustis sp. HA2171]